jgi:hypothetical protein
METEKPPVWVLVWDIDGTLAGDYFDVNNKKNMVRKPTINPHAVEVLKEAVKARDEGRVDAILYLTNNSDKDFIDAVLKEIDEQVFGGRVHSKPTFDTGLKAGDKERIVQPGESINSATKSFYDVEIMLRRLGKGIENLSSRVLFFDDMTDHILTQQLVAFGKKDNFIHITPAFTARNGGRNTKTRWDYVKEVLKGMPEEAQNVMRGGRRLTKKYRRGGLTKKKSRSKI